MAQNKAQAAEIIKRLEKEYPQARIALTHSNPLELLVSVILSAQSTDVGVNKVTPALFKKYPTLADYANADPLEFEKDIHSTGFFRNKTRNILATVVIIKEKFNGEVPRTMEELITLPGVARKTANIVLYNAYGVIAGIAVDTHVGRLSRRLGLSANKDPQKIEKDLMAQIPTDKWGQFSYLLIEHGRAVCIARKAKCGQCFLNDICPAAFKV